MIAARKAPAQHATLINVAFTAYSELAKQDQQLGRDQAFAIGLGLYARELRPMQIPANVPADVPLPQNC